MATEYRDATSGSELDPSGAGGTIDPAAIGTAGHEPEPGEQPRKRRKRSDAGQPRGTRGTRSGTSKASQKVALDLSALTGMFVGLHVMLAERTETPELAITEDEGKAFMEAAQNVMRHYSVETTQKALDWTAFVGCAAGMYMPRMAAIGMRKRSNRQPSRPRSTTQSPPAPPAQVVPIVPDMNSGAGFQEG